MYIKTYLLNNIYTTNFLLNYKLHLKMYLIQPKNKFEVLNKDHFFINNPETALWFFKDGIPELSLIQWCRDTFAQSDKNFIDIGAHIGTYAWSLASKSKHVYAFECNPEVYNCLCANIYLKGFSSKIEPYKIGLSDHSGIETYYTRSPDGGGNGFTLLNDKKDVTKLKLEVRSLDSYKLDNIGFIKIDVEGHELEVLKGSTETFKINNNPPFIFESWSPTDSVKKGLRYNLFDYIKSEMKYTIQNINGYGEMFLATKNNK